MPTWDDVTDLARRLPGAELGSAHDEELIVRELDLDRITEVRQTWQFFRDRRPDAYDDLVRP